MMSSQRASILLFITVLCSTTGYKLPDQSFLTQDDDKTLLTLIRMVRDIPDKKTTESKLVVKYPSKTEMFSKSPLEKSPEVTPYIMLISEDSHTTPKIMAQDETTPLDNLDHASTEADKLSRADFTQTDEMLTAAKTAAKQMESTSIQEQFSTPVPSKSEDLTAITKSTVKTAAKQMESTSIQEQFSTPVPSKSKDLTAITKSTVIEATTLGQIPSTHDKLSSTPESTSNAVKEETTSVIPIKPNDTPSKPLMTSAEPTTNGRILHSSSITSIPVTHISTTSEDKMLTQSLIKQCMLTILILAVVCTIFIITTIALAAKLCTMRQRQKLRHPATYTEMRCISTLLPESDQHSKGKPKLKTFAALEESDGDNTTLNSFLPDH